MTSNNAPTLRPPELTRISNGFFETPSGDVWRNTAARGWQFYNRNHRDVAQARMVRTLARLRNDLRYCTRVSRIATRMGGPTLFSVRRGGL